MTQKRLLGGVVAVNILFTLVHGAVHETIPVVIAPWQSAFVGLTIVVGPLIALGLVAAGYDRIGLTLCALLGFSAFAFEALFHFVMENPDHVAHVTHGAVVFEATAWLSVFGDLSLVAVVGLLAHSQSERNSPTVDSV
jgi:hypothetical protein